MARVTVEDCVLMVPNRFDLVMLAAQRARDISAGASLTIERDNDKIPVVALREIADQTIDLDNLGNSLVRGLQKHVEADEPDEEDLLDFDMPRPGAEDGQAALGGVESDAGLIGTADSGAEAEASSDESSSEELGAPESSEDSTDEITPNPDVADEEI